MDLGLGTFEGLIKGVGSRVERLCFSGSVVVAASWSWVLQAVGALLDLGSCDSDHMFATVCCC